MKVFIKTCVPAAVFCALATNALAFDYNAGSVGPDFRYAGWRGPLARIYDAGWQKVIDGRCNGQVVMAGGLGADFMLDGKTIRVFKRHAAGIRGNGMSEPGGGHMQPSDYVSTLLDLGLIRCSYGTSELADKSLDWTRQTLTLEYMPETEADKLMFIDAELPTLSVTWSRLTPAIRINTEVESVVLLGGPQGNWLFNGKYEPQRLSPRFVAFGTHDGAANAIAPACVPGASIGGAEPLPPPDGFANWMLMWYGAARGIFANRFPACWPSRGSPDRPDMAGNPYWADIPFLVLFENAPCGISAPDSGGIQLDFIGPAGNMVLLPIFGEYYPEAAETAKWQERLPEDIAGICDWWAERLREYPARVEESYEYDRETDTTTIVNKFEYEKISELPGRRFAPVPPMLALAAANGFPVEFNGKLEKSSCATAYGWYCGVEGTDTVRWAVKGLGKYVDEARVSGPAGEAERAYIEKLNRECDKILEAGMLAPGLFATHRGAHLRTLWSDPSDSMFYLSDMASLLPERKSELMEYCAGQDRLAPVDKPEGLLPPDFGARREWGGESVEAERFRAAFDDVIEKNTRGEGRQAGGGFVRGLHEVLNQLLMPQAYYNVSVYMLNGGSFDLAARWPALAAQLDPWLRQSDWASLGWFGWNRNRRDTVLGFLWHDGDYGVGGASDANAWFAGALGYARLARLAGDERAETLGRGLFAKAAALRMAMNKTAKYYYSAGIFELPVGKNLINPPARNPKYGAGEIFQLGPDWDIWTRRAHGIIIDGGGPHRQEWAIPEDDTRVPTTMNEFGISLADTGGGEAMGWGLLIALHGAVPEMGRFLKDFAASENTRYLEQIMDQQPDWFLTHADSIYGCEHSDNMPQNGQGLFLGLAWIKEAAAGELARHLDVPVMRVGDYYYTQKLCETIRACRGVRWEKCAALH